MQVKPGTINFNFRDLLTLFLVVPVGTGAVIAGLVLIYLGIYGWLTLPVEYGGGSPVVPGIGFIVFIWGITNFAKAIKLFEVFSYHCSSCDYSWVLLSGNKAIKEYQDRLKSDHTFASRVEKCHGEHELDTLLKSEGYLLSSDRQKRGVTGIILGIIAILIASIVVSVILY